MSQGLHRYCPAVSNEPGVRQHFGVPVLHALTTATGSPQKSHFFPKQLQLMGFSIHSKKRSLFHHDPFVSFCPPSTGSFSIIVSRLVSLCLASTGPMSVGGVPNSAQFFPDHETKSLQSKSSIHARFSSPCAKRLTDLFFLTE